jgi:hypothetical protein
LQTFALAVGAAALVATDRFSRFEKLVARRDGPIRRNDKLAVWDPRNWPQYVITPRRGALIGPMSEVFSVTLGVGGGGMFVQNTNSAPLKMAA